MLIRTPKKIQKHIVTEIRCHAKIRFDIRRTHKEPRAPKHEKKLVVTHIRVQAKIRYDITPTKILRRTPTHYKKTGCNRYSLSS